MHREIHRAALLIFPGVSLSREYLKQIKDEGYTDIGVPTISKTVGDMFVGQGFSFEQTQELGQYASDLGLGLIVFTGYMKYRESFLRDHPESAMKCLGGEGATLDSDNVAAYHWLCPFQPANKTDYMELLSKIITLPALREIHLNDEAALGFANETVGCYCDHCISEYKEKTGKTPPLPKDANTPEWWDWITWRMEHWTEVHAKFRRTLKAIRPDVAVGIQHSVFPVSFYGNPRLFGIDLGRDAEAQDLLCTDPYHFIHFPLFKYRPYRRILTEATRTLAGATIKRGLNIYPQAFVPPLNGMELTHRDGLMAGIVPFALGADTITPYAYELAQIIPEFAEGMQEAAKLTPQFEKTRPYAFTTVLLPNQTNIYGHAECNWGWEYLTKWPGVMNHAGLPWRWIFDNRLADVTDELAGPLIVPEAHCLTAEQRDVIRTHCDGHGVLWIGRIPNEDWQYGTANPPPEGNVAHHAELRIVSREHPAVAGVTDPVILLDAFMTPGIAGKTVCEFDGKPALVVSEDGNRREAWLAGMPAFNYVSPNGHGALRKKTDGIALLRSTLQWLCGRKPLAQLTPFPPANDFGNLRPWDMHDVPTMELFPMLGDDSLVCIVFNYVPLAYQTNLAMRVPDGVTLKSLMDLRSGKNILASATITGTTVTLPLNVPGKQEYSSFELNW